MFCFNILTLRKLNIKTNRYPLARVQMCCAYPKHTEPPEHGTGKENQRFIMHVALPFCTWCSRSRSPRLTVLAALKTPNAHCQTSEIFKPAPWNNNRKTTLKSIKSLCHCVQCKKFRLTWNTSSLGLIICIMDGDLQVHSQQSAGANGKHSLLHSRQKAICSFYAVVCRIMILFTLFSKYEEFEVLCKR